MTELCKVCYPGAQHCSSLPQEIPTFSLSPPQCFTLTSGHCSISTTSHATMLTLLPLFPAWLHSVSHRNVRNRFFSDLPEAQRGRCEPHCSKSQSILWETHHFPLGSSPPESRERESDKMFSLRDIYLKYISTYIFKKTKKNQRLVQHKPLCFLTEANFYILQAQLGYKKFCKRLSGSNFPL